MKRNTFTVDQVLAAVLSSDDEDLDNDDYSDDSDSESENNDSNAESETDSDSDIAIQTSTNVGAVPRGNNRGRVRARGRGRGRGLGVRHASPPGWTRNTAGFVELQFTPNEKPGPKNLPNEIKEESTPLDYFSLFWDDVLWDLLLTETNRQAAHVIAAKPNNYAAKSFQRKPLTLPELKAFFGLRCTMEMLIHRDRYEQYWRSKDTTITYTPGFAEVMTRDRFLAIWSLLHCVNEDDPQLDKTDKIYKTRPVFNHLIDKFKHYYVPNCELSLDEGMIPTKNKLSFKQYIKDKPIRWGIKTFLLCDSENGYIVNAEVYTGRRADAEAIPNIGITGNLVVRMTDEFKDQNYTLYTDRFYTSVQLTEYLLNNKGIRMCGTAMTNRREFPKTLIRRNNEMQKGD